MNFILASINDTDGRWRAGTVRIFLSDSLNFSWILETKAILTVTWETSVWCFAACLLFAFLILVFTARSCPLDILLWYLGSCRDLRTCILQYLFPFCKYTEHTVIPVDFCSWHVNVQYSQQESDWNVENSCLQWSPSSQLVCSEQEEFPRKADNFCFYFSSHCSPS